MWRQKDRHVSGGEGMRPWLQRVLPVLLIMLPAGSASALEELKDEKDRIKACEARLCSLVTKKTPDKGSFACSIAKTWRQDQIKKGSSGGAYKWGFGDARCSVDLKLDNGQIVGALSSAKATLQFPDHTVECIVERDKQATPVKLTLAPKVDFKDGKARKIWVNLKAVDGPPMMRGIAMSVAQLEDTVGIFHKRLVKSVNKLLDERCPKVVSGG
jgi:hypothetical protein